MRKIILTLCILRLVAALAAPATAASGHHHTRSKGSAEATERLRNSNAYAVPGGIAVQSDPSNYSEGAITSGPAGH